MTAEVIITMTIITMAIITVPVGIGAFTSIMRTIIGDTMEIGMAAGATAEDIMAAEAITTKFRGRKL